jgi:hypothetical protein
MSLKDVPEVESYVRSILSIKTNKSVTSKSINDLEHGASFDIEKIVETTDSISNKNYSIRFVFDDTPENVFYNLVVNFLPNGQKHAFVQKQTCNPENYIAFRNSRYDMNYFNGKIELFYYTAFFGKKATAVLAKTTAKPCSQSYYPNGDPIPTLRSFITSGGIQSSGGSSSTGGIPNTTNGNASWPATGGYGLSVFSIGNNQSSSDLNGNNTSNNSGGGLGSVITNIGSAITGFISSIGTAISDTYQNTFRWLRSFCGSCDPTRKTTDPCPTIVPLGFTTFISEPERLAILRSQIPLKLEQWQFLHGKDEFMDVLIDYSNRTKNREKVINISQQAIYFIMNNSVKVHSFANYMIKEQIANPNLFFDINTSFKSPMNIDLSSIPYDITKPENQKFNEVYKSLTESPEFKKLFESIFKDSKRFNVKFEIVENLDNNGKKINGYCRPTNKNNLIIQISKQILTPSGIRPKKDIEIAKTILHECIHAYLAIKGKYPDAGQKPIPGIENMTFEEVLKATRPGKDVQHDFMYNNMRPTMQKILGEIRDRVTTPATRAVVEAIRLQPTFYTNPQNKTPWNWNDYFYYLSLDGLHNTEGFIKDFPKNTNQYELLMEYLFFGHKNL